MILTRNYSQILVRHASAPQRAWLISPDGKPFPCGQDHSECEERYPDLLKGRRPSALIKEGWGQVGYFGYADSVYLHVSALTEPLFRAYQDLVATLKIGPKFRVEVITPRDTLAFSYKDFQKFESLDDLIRFGKVRLTSSYSWVPRLAAIVDYRGQTFDPDMEQQQHPYFQIGHGGEHWGGEGSEDSYLWAWIDGKLDVRGPTSWKSHGFEWDDGAADLTYKGRYDPGKNKVSLVVPDRWMHREIPSGLMSRLEQRFPGADISVF